MQCSEYNYWVYNITSSSRQLSIVKNTAHEFIYHQDTQAMQKVHLKRLFIIHFCNDM